MEHLIDKTIKNLKINNMNGYYAADKNELFNIIGQLIDVNSTVGCGDSVTLEQLGVFDYLRDANVTFFDKHKDGLTTQQKREIYLNNFRGDVFITGSNAITVNGEILNIDGNGSRVAPMLYGPQRVVIVVGTNKLVNDLHEGHNRARQIAAPLDAERLNKDTPCTKLKKCIDCKAKNRICNSFVTITRQFNADRIHVIIVNGSWGY